MLNILTLFIGTSASWSLCVRFSNYSKTHSNKLTWIHLKLKVNTHLYLSLFVISNFSCLLFNLEVQVNRNEVHTCFCRFILIFIVITFIVLSYFVICKEYKKFLIYSPMIHIDSLITWDYILTLLSSQRWVLLWIIFSLDLK